MKKRKQRPEISDCAWCGARSRHSGNNKPHMCSSVEQAIGNFYVRCGNCYVFGPNEESTVDGINAWNMMQERIKQGEHAAGLLAALEYAIEMYGKPGGPWNVPSDPGGWIDRARAAIAMAEPKMAKKL